MSQIRKLIFSHGRVPGVLILYLLLQPILDILTSVSAQSGSALTAGTIIRALFVVAVALWLLFSGPYPGRRGILVCTGLITGYLALYCLWSLLAGGFSLCLTNAAESIKVFYFLYTALFLLALYRQRQFVMPLWVIAAAGAGYCLVIVIAFLTGTSFISYNAGYGYCGWFYSANDVSNIILLSAPIVLCLCFERLTAAKTWYSFLGLAVVLFSVVFSAAFIGTKLVYLGVLLYLGCALIWFLVRTLLFRQKALRRSLLAAFLLCVLLLAIYPISPLNAYINDVYVPMSGEDQAALEASQAIPGLVEVDRAKKHAEMEAAAEGTWLGELIRTDPLVKKLDWILSRRLLSIAPILQEYLDGDSLTKLIGLGYGQTPDYTKDIVHLVEMEPLALLLRHGIIGLFVYYIPCLILAFWLMFRFFRKLKTWLADLTYCSVLYSAMVALAASVIVGHILQTPSVSLFVAMIYGQLTCRTVNPGSALLSSVQ